MGKGTITTMSCDLTSNGYQPITDYVFDQSGGQMSEVSVANGQSNWQHTNVTANGMLIATYDTAGLHFHLSDALGTRRVQTDSAGFPEQTCQSLPFGDQLYCTGSLNSPTEHHFTGKERDAESGLDYFGARYYESNMGRWMSPDWGPIPVGVPYASINDPQSLNLYTYVGNNPMSHRDPDGHRRECAPDTMAVGTNGTYQVTAENCTEVPDDTPLAQQQKLPQTTDSITVTAEVLAANEELGPIAWISAGILLGTEACIQTHCGTAIHDLVSHYLIRPMFLKTRQIPMEPRLRASPERKKASKSQTGAKWGKAPNGKYGWVDSKGNVWVPTGQGDLAHVGVH